MVEDGGLGISEHQLGLPEVGGGASLLVLRLLDRILPLQKLLP